MMRESLVLIMNLTVFGNYIPSRTQKLNNRGINSVLTKPNRETAAETKFYKIIDLLFL